MTLIAVVNGPNLNLLGSREPQVYGETTLDELGDNLRTMSGELGVEVELFQSNHEGAIIDYLQRLPGRAGGLIINPGALTHYSYALRDALAALDFVIIEVHISNIHCREEWRSSSVISAVVNGVIAGFGPLGYRLALEAAAGLLREGENE
jgi:3-dehydroquinate dehydratase-2